MQVFRAFLLVFNKHKGQVLMYVCIFVGIMSLIMSSSDSSDEYTSKQSEFAVFDYDESAISKGFIDSLSESDTLVEIENDDKETMQDELYARNVDCIVIIKKGFGDNLADAEKYLDLVTIPNTSAATSFKGKVDGFLNVFKVYIAGGYDVEEALEKTYSVMETEVEVSLPDGDDAANRSKAFSFYNYLGWVMVVMIVSGITPVLQVFSKPDVKARISVSAYKYSNYNKELVLGVACACLAVCALFGVLSVVMLEGEMFSAKGAMLVLNMICYMIVSISIAFLIAKISSNEEIISLLSNIISLGMAFISGIFVPAEFLGDTVLKVAHFMPAYWYSEACKNIDIKMSDNMGRIFMCIGMQLIFAVIIFVAAVIVDKRKKK